MGRIPAPGVGLTAGDNVEIKKIHHIAVAVEDIDKAAEFWQEVLGLELEHVEEVESQDEIGRASCRERV